MGNSGSDAAMAAALLAAQQQHKSLMSTSNEALAKLNIDVKNFKLEPTMQQHHNQLAGAYFSIMNGFGLEDLTARKSLQKTPKASKSSHNDDDDDIDDENDIDDDDNDDDNDDYDDTNSSSMMKTSPNKSESPSCSSSGRHRPTSRGGASSALVSSSGHSLDPHDDDHSSMTPSSSRSISPSSSSYRGTGADGVKVNGSGAGAAGVSAAGFDPNVLSGLNNAFPGLAAAAAASTLPSDPLSAAAAIGVNPAQLPLTNNVASMLATRKRRSERDSTGERNKKIKPVPDDKKDDAYWERRRKNNEAAKRSRDLRRQKEDEIAVRAAFLEQENLKLRAQVTILKAELSKLHFMIYNR